jgi:arylsulfatase A-like enzyme
VSCLPPKGAPNVLLIMTDDEGFGAPSTFGGVIPTPTMDRIAAQGLRYTNFHSTPLCSPTRAAIITGRNHHSAGFGVVGEAATGFPGYDSIIPIEKGTIGTILKENGYATSWFGKDHNTPFYQASQAGPFNQWPNGMGFDYFHGFVGGDASQWQPNLFRNTTAIYPFQGNPGWNLETAMADEAIQYMKQLKEIAPDKPFFVYYVPGATHAPHHPTPEWIKKISDMHLFDDGWNKVRETIFAKNSARCRSSAYRSAAFPLRKRPPPHLHMIVPGGGIALDGSRWISSSEDYLLPVSVLSQLFCGKTGAAESSTCAGPTAVLRPAHQARRQGGV